MSFTEIVPGQIWVCPMSLRFLGIQIGTRMTIIRLFGGRLFVHSPIELTDNIKEQLKKLGSVSYVVSPNNLHHLYIGDFVDAYSHAKVYASPELPEKRKDLRFRYHLTDKADDEWKDDIDQTIFLGHSMLREVVFFHHKSKTLLLADLLMYFHEESAPLTKLVTKFMGMYKKPVPPLDFKSSLTERLQAKISVEKILSWDFDRIILAHGRIIETNGKQIFKDAFSWLWENNE